MAKMELADWHRYYNKKLLEVQLDYDALETLYDHKVALLETRDQEIADLNDLLQETYDKVDELEEEIINRITLYNRAWDEIHKLEHKVTELERTIADLAIELTNMELDKE